MEVKKLLYIAGIILSVCIILFFIFAVLVVGAALPFFYWLITASVSFIVLVLVIISLLLRRNWHLHTGVLIVADITLSAMLCLFYFLMFCVGSKISWLAVTVGLPVLIAIGFLIFCTVSVIRKKDQKMGMFGLISGLGAYIYITVILLFFGNLLLAFPQNVPQNTANTEEDKILAYLLWQFCSQKHPAVIVDPRYSHESLVWLKSYFSGSSTDNLGNGYYQIGDPSYGVTIEETRFNDLVDRYDDETFSKQTLQIPSSLRDGYYIDYANRYTTNLHSSLFHFWYLVRPYDHRVVEVPPPYYDRESGLVIFYIHWDGYSWVYLYKWQDGKAITLDVIEWSVT